MNEPQQIDARLASIGKDRAWLAENTPYSADYIRTVLAPNSKRRTERVLQVLTAAIAREEAAQQQSREGEASTPQPPLRDHIVLEVPPATHDQWAAAAAAQGKALKPWAIEELNHAAAEWHQSRQLRVAEDPAPYKSHPKKGTGGSNK